MKVILKTKNNTFLGKRWYNTNKFYLKFVSNLCNINHNEDT